MIKTLIKEMMITKGECAEMIITEFEMKHIKCLM